MNKISLYTFLCAFLTISVKMLHGQDHSQSPITITAQYGPSEKGLKDYLSFEGVNYQSTTFTSKDLIGKHFLLLAKEVWNGEVKETHVLANSLTSGKSIKDSVFEVRVLSKRTEDQQWRTSIVLQDYRTGKTFKLTNSPLYDLRNIVRDRKQPLRVGEKFYFMAHILPIPIPGRPGALSYCNVDNSGEEVIEWGKKLGIEHYIIFELEFF